MKVCTKCGWYEHSQYSYEECHPQRGVLADLLVAATPGIETAKLGWGTGCMALGKLKEHELTVHLSVHDDCFNVKDISIIGADLSVAEAADLVKILVAWHDRVSKKVAN